MYHSILRAVGEGNASFWYNQSKIDAERKRRVYYTYILCCADGTYYTGFTTDPDARTAQHNAGKGAKYTRSRRPVRKVWQAAWTTEHEARSCEWHIKRLTRREKECLVQCAPETAAYRAVWAKVAARVARVDG